MAGTFVLTVTAVKPYSGYYPCCHSCLRKLKVLGSSRSARYMCKRCQLQYGPDEVPHRYCIALTVADHSACGDVVIFGECLNPIFGTPASRLHQNLQEKCSMGMINPIELPHLLNTSLRSVLIGRCFTFSFRIRTTLVPSQFSDILKLNCSLPGKPEQSLIVSSIKSLGKANQTVLATIESHLQNAESSFTAQSQDSTSTKQSCDSSSLLYDSVGAGSSLVFRLESYCEPSNVCSATGISSSHTGTCLSSGSLAVMKPGQLESSLCEEYSLSDLRCLISESSVNFTPNCTETDDVYMGIGGNDPTAAGVDEIQFTDSEANEILQELILDWESSQQPQATTRHPTSVIQSTSLLTDSIPEQEISPSAWSVDFLRDFMSSFSDPTPTHSTSDCIPRKPGSVFTPSLCPNTTSSTPELFSSASSQKMGKTFNYTSNISPEMFGSSDSTTCSTVRQPYTQSSKFVTPAIHRTHPRRNILKPTTCSSHPQGAERRMATSAAVHDSRTSLGAVTGYSPELFSP